MTKELNTIKLPYKSVLKGITVSFTQDSRFLEFISPLGKDKLQLTKAIIKEEIGRPYYIQAELLSNYQGIDSLSMLGQPAKVIIYKDEERVFQGIITQFEQSGTQTNGRQRYNAEIRPWLVGLEGNEHNRYFYDLSVPDVTKVIMQGLGYNDINLKQLFDKYPKKRTIAQYQEHDLDFIHRILADEQLYYLFEQGKTAEQPYLRDRPVGVGNTAYEVSTTHPGKPHISVWKAKRRAIPKQIVINKYQHTHPSIAIEASQNTLAQATLAGGRWLYTDEDVTSDAEALKKVRHHIDAWAADSQPIEIASNIAGLTVGHSYNITHPNDTDKDGQYVVLAVTHIAIDHSYHKDASDELHYSNTAVIQSNNQAIVPTVIPTQKISHAQSARVITPTGQNIYTNEYAAIKTKMSWQQDDNINVQRLPWARVGQWQSGMRWGTQFIPRVDDEVLVDFFQGNPDNPVVIGSIYNANHKPAYSVEDYTGLTSINTQLNNLQAGHQLNFDDKPNVEMLRLLVQGDYKEAIKNDAKIAVNGKDDLSVNGKYKTQVNAGQSQLSADTAILQVGSNQIIMDTSGIKLNGNKVTLKSSGVGGAYPVARLGDDHSCNSMTGLIPHTGGAINSGSSLFVVNDLPAARVNDTASCLPETDTISEGINNIQIKGIPLARVAHATKHGGKITTGSANVYVDDAGFTTSVMSDILNPTAGTMNIGQHWIQGHYPDEAGMSWRIVHQDGLAYQGVLDQEGKTEKLTNLPNGTADIYFGDKPQLEDKLAKAREDLKTQLAIILATSKKANEKPTAFIQAWENFNHSKSSLKLFNNFRQLQYQTIRTVIKGVTNAAKASGHAVVHLYMENAKWQTIQDQALEADFEHNPEKYQQTINQASELTQEEMQGLEKAYAFAKLVMTDEQTRKILMDFSVDFYHQTPGIVIAEQALEIIGGIYFAIITAAVGGEVTLLSELTEANSTIAALNTAHTDAETIAETLEELKKVKVINGAEVDRVHKVETPEYESAKAKLDAYQSPDDFDDAKDRLTQSRTNIMKNACKEVLKYSDTELAALAAKEVAPKDGYLVRLVKAAPDDMDLERGLVADSKTTWSTTFEQIESADTDPRLIASKLGIPYEPGAKYSLMIIKDVAATTTDASVPTRLFMPTFGNLTGVAEANEKVAKLFATYDVSDGTLNTVMNSEYSDEFFTLMQEMKEQLGDDIYSGNQVEEFLYMTADNPKLAMARYIMNNYYGASEYYLGDGTTQYMGEAPAKGALEYMLYDETGITLQQLKDQNKLSILACNPISQCPIVGVK